MKIAQVAPLYESVPPRFYGGTERVVDYVVNELVDLGHDVTLFAAGESKTKARLVSSRERAVWRDKCPHRSEMAAHMSMLHEVRAQAEEFDVIHFHLEILPCPIFEAVADRTLTTMHGRLDYQDYQRFFRYWPQYPLASISNSQRSPLPFVNWAGTVYHGLPLNHLRPTFNPERGYLAFLGRVCPEKRPDVAIRLAQRTGRHIRLAANVQPENAPYFREKVEPLLDQGNAELIGEVCDADKSAFLGNAEALIFPINWPEPFGLVMIEAMACGTPVIAWNHGSVPEVIEDGVTGFIVDNEQEAAEALEKVADLDRRRIRAEFEHRFTARDMARDYVRLYETLRGNHE